MTDRPLLSISMMTPGKKRTLRDCLQALDHLRQTIPCELVIVDTGCDKEHRAIIEEYADKIVNFTWCDDFSKARNSGLKECAGEWFLFIDDDEVFKDTKALEDFFLSGEYKNQKEAKIRMRDYKNWDETEYYDFYLSRMVKLEKDVHFVNKIHEGLNCVTGNGILLDVLLGHYGYIYETQEEKWAHSFRNVEALERELAAEPDNYHYVQQLGQEYRAVDEWSKLENLFRDYYHKMQQVGGMNRVIRSRIFVAGLCTAIIKQYRYEEAMKVAEEGLADSCVDEAAHAILYQCAAISAYRMGDYATCIRFGYKYHETYEKYKDAKEYWSSVFFVEDGYEENGYGLVMQIALMAAILNENNEGVGSFTEMIHWKEKGNMIHEELPKVICDVMEKGADLPNMEGLLEYILKDDSCGEFFLKEVREREKGSPAFRERIAPCFVNVDSENDYVILLQLYEAKRNDENPKSVEVLVRRLLQSADDVLNLDDFVYELMVQFDISLEEVILEKPLASFAAGIRGMMKHASGENLDGYKAWVDRIRTVNDIHYMLFDMEYYYSKFCMEENSYEERREYLKQYLEFACFYFHEIYTEEALTMGVLLSTEAVIYLTLSKFMENEEQKRYKEALQCLKDAFGLSPELDCALRSFSHQYGDYVNTMTQHATSEMELLGQQIKQQVKVLLEAGQKAQARAILMQIAPLLPQDEEIKLLLEQTGED
ncbi:Glycosyltransferase involved in cell wall bisynthesis [Lachnospiraceae bacterium XBD2001]|nr:Glycosyltransferase involved in cell wall bisynthesis [Lachnospiraceae bacterium XBD2001]